MITLHKQTWGDVRVGDVLVDYYIGRRTVTAVHRASAPGYRVVEFTRDGPKPRSAPSGTTTGGHKLAGELTLERGVS